MPAFGYKERFVPFVKDFTKTGTIRAFRKYLIRPGQTSYHYFGMRTKFCTELIDPQPIKTVETIWIFKTGTVYISDKLYTKEEAEALMRSRTGLRKFMSFLEGEKDELAWNDGFRHEDDLLNQQGCFEKMIRFWRLTHELPFCGQYIKWR